MVLEQTHSDYVLIFAVWSIDLCLHMRAFLQSLDEKVWQAVEIGWVKPKETPTD